MNLPLVFRPEVRDDVDNAYTWYGEQRSGLGEDFLSEVQSTLDRIQQNPGLHPKIYRDVRCGLVSRFPFAVWYRTELERVVIIAVYHQRRDPQGWHGRV